MIRRPPRSTQSRSSAASDVYKRQGHRQIVEMAGQACGSRHVLERKVPGVEPQPVDVAAVGLITDPQAGRLQAEGAALEEKAVAVSYTHLTLPTIYSV